MHIKVHSRLCRCASYRALNDVHDIISSTTFQLCFFIRPQNSHLYRPLPILTSRRFLFSQSLSDFYIPPRWSLNIYGLHIRHQVSYFWSSVWPPIYCRVIAGWQFEFPIEKSWSSRLVVSHPLLQSKHKSISKIDLNWNVTENVDTTHHLNL